MFEIPFSRKKRPSPRLKDQSFRYRLKPWRAEIVLHNSTSTVSSLRTGSGLEVAVSGHVAGDEPASVGVSFSGAVSKQATTDENGDFSLIATASGLGPISAVADDGNGSTSEPTDTDLKVSDRWSRLM